MSVGWGREYVIPCTQTALVTGVGGRFLLLPLGPWLVEECPGGDT